MATLSDVAARAGVSISAASRVLSDAADARVSAATRERIRTAADELGYRPNFAARALKFSRTNVVALMVPDLTNAIFTELMRGVDDEAARLGYTVVLSRAERLATDPDELSRLIGEGRVDGALLHVGDDVTQDVIAPLVESRLPLVFVNSNRFAGAGSVVLDDEAAAREATEHLLRLGHRRIAFLGGVPTSDTGARRRAGYAEALGAAGIAVDESLVGARGYEPRSGAEALADVLAVDEPPTAVVVANVNAAIGALGEARRGGLAVPDDLSIITLHDAWTAENTWPPLTAVRMPLYEFGRAAMRALVERITEGASGDLVVSEPGPMLVARESTAPPR